jgi:hypothetical protein
MIFDETQPADSSLLNSAPHRANFAALQMAAAGRNLAAPPLIWPYGDSAAPAHYLVGGTGVTPARETSIVKVEAMCPKIVAGAGTGWIRQSLMEVIRADLRSQYVSLGVYLYGSAANVVRAWIEDGVDTTYSAFAYSGLWAWFKLAHLTNAAATRLRVGMDVAAGYTGYMDGLTVVLGPVPPALYHVCPSQLGTAHFPFVGEAEEGAIKAFWGPGAPTLVESVHLEAGEAPTGQALIADLNHWDGAAYQSMFSTRPQIADGAFAGEAVPDGTYRYRCFDACHAGVITDARMGVDFDQVGNTTAGSDVHANVRCRQFLRFLDAYNAHDEHGASA